MPAGCPLTAVADDIIDTSSPLLPASYPAQPCLLPTKCRSDLTEPAINVRLQPNCSDRGNMKIVSVVMLGAMRANTAVPDAPTTTHP